MGSSQLWEEGLRKGFSSYCVAQLWIDHIKKNLKQGYLTEEIWETQ